MSVFNPYQLLQLDMFKSTASIISLLTYIGAVAASPATTQQDATVGGPTDFNMFVHSIGQFSKLLI